MSYEYMTGLGTNGDQEEGLIEKAENAFMTFFYPEQPEQPEQPPAPMPGATPSGKPTAQGFSEYAKETAIREGAAAEDEVLPVQELPSDDPGERQAQAQTWIERYQTHITIGSTLIGLVTFGIWLIVRKR